MARLKGPKKVHRYSVAFNLKAVWLNRRPGVLIRDVAESLRSPRSAVSAAASG